MKKFMFSAIAMIAFVGSSMASGEVKIAGLVGNASELMKSEKLQSNPCFKTAMKMMDIVEADMGVIDDIVEYNNIYQYYVRTCELGLIRID